MKLHMDFHIHTALSPCGDDDMTPNNIVNMAVLKGLNAVGITDHNSCGNVKACIEASIGSGLLVIPGMELQTREEIHVLCLFKNLESALSFQDYIYEHLPRVDNKPEIFGEQIIFDCRDNIVGYNEKMLLSSSGISFDEACRAVSGLGGAFIPAHVDRDAFSVLTSLGFIPDYLDIKTIEYYSREKLEKLIASKRIPGSFNFIKSSDAHYLNEILEQNEAVEINAKASNIDAGIVVEMLKSGLRDIY